MRARMMLCALGVVLLMACDAIISPGACGCSPPPPPPGTVLKATVLTAGELPAANARVVVELLANDICDVAASGSVYGTGTTNASGVVYLPLVRVSTVAWCARVTAEGAQVEQGRPSAPSLLTVRANAPVAPAAPDTTVLTLRLRA